MASGRKRIIGLAGLIALLGVWASARGQSQAGAPALGQLQKMIEAAPARQVGQPGNDVIDRMIQERFTQAVARHNDPARATAARQALDVAARADIAFTAARDAAKVVPEIAEGAQPPLATRVGQFIAEAHWHLTWGLLALAALMLVAWKFQRRKALLVVGVVFSGLTVALPIVGTILKQANSSAQKAGDTSTAAGLEAIANEAALASWKADTAAAAAVRGLWQTGRVTYPTAVFLPGQATLAVPNAPPMRLYALAPNLMEPANLPPAGFSGPLVYLGKAGPLELAGRGKSLEGAAVIVDFDSGRRWLDTVQLGARVVIVLEPAEDAAAFTEAAQKKSESPLSVPRFYLKRADLLEALGESWEGWFAAGATAQITQEKPNVWERREVAADWLFIPPDPAAVKSSASADGQDDGPQLVHFQTYKDSRSIVPELSPGAQSAGNLVLLLRLLEQYEKQPPKRPVLLSIVNDHTNALLGEQEFNFAAFSDYGMIRRELEGIENTLAQKRFIYGICSRKPTAELIEKLRDQISDVAGSKLTVKKPITDRLTLLRNTIREERKRLHLKLEEDSQRVSRGLSARIASDERAAMESRIKQIEVESEELNQVLKLFNKFGVRVHFDDLTPRQHAKLEEVYRQLADEHRVAMEELERARKQLSANLEMRRRLMFLQPEPAVEVKDVGTDLGQRYRPLPALLMVGLDLGFGSDQCGFFYMGHMKSEDAAATDKNRLSELARYTIQIANEHARATGKPSILADTIRGVAGQPWQAYLGGCFALASDAIYQYQLPGLTLTSIHDMRPYDFTPHDQVSRIDPEKFASLLSFAESYLPRLADSPDLSSTVKSPGTLKPLTVELSVRRHDQFAVQIPELPLPGALVVVFNPDRKLPNNAMMFGQVQPNLMLIADGRGSAMVRGSIWRNASPLAVEYDRDFRRLRGALDLSDWEKRLGGTSITARANEYYMPRTMVVAGFEKVDLIGLTQPLVLSPVTAIGVLEAGQESLPRHFAVMGVGGDALPTPKAVPLSGDGSGSLFMEPESSFKLRIGSGLAINASAEQPKGEGFPSESVLLSNLVLASAKDMWFLTDQRLKLLSNKGVTNETADLYNKDAARDIERAEEAQKAGKNAELLINAEVARGLAFRAYQRGRSTIDDLTKAVVIFLALVIPFCVFVTKLTSPFNDVNRNLGMFIGVFVAMALALRLVHPAFAIAETPEVVILAFVILGLAGFVAGVLISKFNSSMTQAVEESQLAESVEAPQSRLAGVAFVVGINNMKRRRIRTSLTTATIVLVTFTMLSVISVGQDIAPATVRVSQSAPYSGFLFASSGLAPIDAFQMNRLRAHFEGKATVVARAWAQRTGSFGEYLGYELQPQQPLASATVTSLTAKVLVGMEVAEDGFVAKMPLVAGRWLSSDSAAEILLSVEAARLVGITPENFRGRKFEVEGRLLDLVGLLDDQALEKMRDMSDVPLLPMLSQASQSRQSENQAQRAAGAATLDVGGGSMAAPGVQIARPLDVAIVSVGFARSLGQADFRCLCVKYEEAGDDAQGHARTPASAASQAWEAANNLIQFQNALVSVGLKETVSQADSNRKIETGQYRMASSSSTQVGGILKIAIPIILAATIILNTMLGSVMERRREVAIYNAIGLNPGHVMVFFLAESLVFGLVGSVAGYLIGQTLSLLITHFHFIDLNLNYSSLSVMVVIFLTIATVLLSTIYPAMMAARAAVPSGQRRWSLPQPVGDEIFVQFPFSYDAERVLGVCAYLREYMRLNSEASTGQFLARLGPVGRVPAEGQAAEELDDAKAYAMIFDVAPAPFDLGVNQKMEVYAYYDAQVKAHMLAVHLTRVSGERGNWVAVNQPFLEALRKRLLGWRSQKQVTQQAFYHEGEKLFAAAPDLPVVGSAAPTAVAQEHA